MDVQPQRPAHFCRPLEKPGGYWVIEPPQRSPPRCSQVRSRPRGQLFAIEPELAPVAAGLLQVVADDLLELREAVAGLGRKPVGEARVQLGPYALADAAVGGV